MATSEGSLDSPTTIGVAAAAWTAARLTQFTQREDVVQLRGIGIAPLHQFILRAARDHPAVPATAHWPRRSGALSP